MEMINRVILNQDPFVVDFPSQEIGNWPVRWLKFPKDTTDQSVVYFKLAFNLDEDTKIRMYLAMSDTNFFLTAS